MKHVVLSFIFFLFSTVIYSQEPIFYDLDFQLPSEFVDGREAQESDVLFCRLDIFNEEGSDTVAVASRICMCGVGDPTRNNRGEGELWSTCSVEVIEGNFYTAELTVYNLKGIPNAPYRPATVYIPARLRPVEQSEVSNTNAAIDAIVQECLDNPTCQSDFVSGP